MAAACALPKGVEGSARSTAACARAFSAQGLNMLPEPAKRPVIRPNFLMKLRRVFSPLSHASISALRPASKSRFLRSFMVVPPKLCRLGRRHVVLPILLIGLQNACGNRQGGA